MAFQEVFGIGALFTFKNVAGAEIRRARSDVAKLKAEINGMKEYNVGVSKAIVTAASGIKYLFAGAAAFFGPQMIALKAGQLEEKMVFLKQVTGATDAQMKGFYATSLKAAQTSKFGMSEVTEAMYQIASAGYTGTQSSRMLGDMMDYATVSGQDLGQTVKDVTSIMHQFNVKAENANKVTSVMIRLQDMTQFNYNELAQGLAAASTSARALNQSLPTVAAWTGAYKQMGFGAMRSSQMVKQALDALRNPVAVKLLTDLGVERIDKATGKYRNLTDIMQSFDKAVKAKGYSTEMIEGLSKKIFQRSNPYSLYRMASVDIEKNGKLVTLHGFEALKYMEQQFKLAEDEALASKRKEEHMKLLVNQWEMVKNNAEAFINVLGGKDIGTPATLEFLKSVNKTLTDMTNWTQANPKTVRAMTELVMAIGKYAMYFGMFKIGLGAIQYITNIPAGLALQWSKIAEAFTVIRNAQLVTGFSAAIHSSGTLLAKMTAISKLPAPALLTAAVWIAALYYAGKMLYLLYELNEVKNEENAATAAANASEKALAAKMRLNYGITTTNPTAAAALMRGRDAIRANPNASSPNAVVQNAMSQYIQSEVNRRFPESQFNLGWDNTGTPIASWGGKASGEAQKFAGEALKSITAEDIAKVMQSNPITAKIYIDGKEVAAALQKIGVEKAERGGQLIAQESRTISQRPNFAGPGMR